MVTYSSCSHAPDASKYNQLHEHTGSVTEDADKSESKVFGNYVWTECVGVCFSLFS